MKVLDDLRIPGQKFVLPGGKYKPVDAEEEVELVCLPLIKIVFYYLKIFVGCLILQQLPKEEAKDPDLLLRFIILHI